MTISVSPKQNWTNYAVNTTTAMTAPVLTSAVKSINSNKPLSSKSQTALFYYTKLKK
jgi:hypothetical protein